MSSAQLVSKEVVADRVIGPEVYVVGKRVEDRQGLVVTEVVSQLERPTRLSADIVRLANRELRCEGLRHALLTVVADAIFVQVVLYSVEAVDRSRPLTKKHSRRPWIGIACPLTS